MPGRKPYSKPGQQPVQTGREVPEHSERSHSTRGFGGLLVTNKMELINTKENRRFYGKTIIITKLCGSAVADILQS